MKVLSKQKELGYLVENTKTEMKKNRPEKRRIQTYLPNGQSIISRRGDITEIKTK